MDTKTKLALTSRQSVPMDASADVPLRTPPSATKLEQVVGRVNENPGGSSQRNSDYSWVAGAGVCSQRDPSPTKGSEHPAVDNSSGLKGLPILRSPSMTAASNHGTALSPAHVSPGGATSSKKSDCELRGNAHGRICHVNCCKEAIFGYMNGYATVPLCEAHLKDNERRVRSNAELAGRKGKAFSRNYVCEVIRTVITQCLKSFVDISSRIIDTSSLYYLSSLTRRDCTSQQYPGCTKKPKYSLIKGGPARACKHHKKAGMFSTRNGQILYAIHDGDALRSVLTSPTSTAPEDDKKSSKLSSDNGRKSMWVKPKTPKTPKTRPGSHTEALKKVSGDFKREATTAIQNETTPDLSASQSDHTAQTVTSCKLSNAKGMAPSIEMKILQKEREKAMAEARATGRRPRIPSLKALEIAGKLKYDGVQWMSKEMYKAEVQLRKEIRERRKEFKADDIQDTPEIRTKMDNSDYVRKAGSSTGEGSTGGNDERNRGGESHDSTLVTLKERTQSMIELTQAGTRYQEPEAVQSQRETDCDASATGGSGNQSQSVIEEANPTVKRNRSSPSLSKPGKKKAKRNPSTASSGKGKGRAIKNGNHRRTSGSTLKNGDEPSGIDGKKEHGNDVWRNGDGVKDMECESAGRF